MKERNILFLLILLSTFSIRLYSENTPTDGSYQITSEGAWCWFADPRALHYADEEGTINKTYIGYIDVHGNIKAMQYDFKNKMQDEVLIRSYFQPDDHNNPTFLVLPDGRIMIFYSRHTDEPCFYYRISRIPGDITTLGEEKIIRTKDNTTYPSPFILSDDPEHIYLCWRGIGWHPTIAKLSLPDEKDDVNIEWGPYQIVKSTGSRPYAKYFSNGKDLIYMAYTTGHPDNEFPNYLYFNYINIQTLQLQDINGGVLSTIADGTFSVNKSLDYQTEHQFTVVDNPSDKRDWVWQVASDKKGNPVIAMVRISKDKESHEYYYAKWTGSEWKKTFLAKAGGHFHQTPELEKCYSAGMALDLFNTDIIYCSLPVEGKYGKVYEIVKFVMSTDGDVISQEAVTKDSRKNNIRPYMIPHSENTSLRLTWMVGDYYDWIVSSSHPQGYPTGIACCFVGFSDRRDEKTQQVLNKSNKFNLRKPFIIERTITLDADNYQGCLLKLGELEYCLNETSMKPEVRYKGKVYPSTNLFGNSDCWQTKSRATDGKWHAPRKYDCLRVRMEYSKGTLSVYLNDLLDQKINLR